MRQQHLHDSLAAFARIHCAFNQADKLFRLIVRGHYWPDRTKGNSAQLDLFAIDLGSRDHWMMPTRLQFQRDSKIWMNVAERTEGRKQDAFSRHCRVVSSRAAVRSHHQLERF